MTDVLYYATTDRITPRAMEILKRARGIAYGEQEIDFVESQPGVGSLNFGHHGLPDGSIRTLGMREMPETPNAEYIVAAAMRSYADRLEYRAPTTSDVLWLDTEADGVEHRWSMPTEKYVRLGQYAWDQDEEVQFVYSAAEVRDLIESAAVVVPHNGHNFDLSVVYGKDSIRPLELALENRIFDPFVAVGMLFPSPTTYVDRKGRLHKSAALPESREGQQDLGWFGLDNLAFQFGLTGKDGDLKALAEEFGGFGAIPLDDPRYLAYARQDVLTLREVTSAVLQFVELDSYDWREQQIAAVMAQISRNGFRVDERAAKHRNATLAQRREELLTRLKETYGFPSEGKMPWRTTAGKKAVLDFLASVDVNPNEDEDWPRTKTGNISLGGDAIIEGTKGTPAEEDARSIAELMGQRSLAQLTLDCLQPDGRVHPEINSLQRSGRTSVTRPGLTVFNGPEKAYYVPSEGCSLVSVDYSAADGRAVAAMSGDAEYAKRFEPGVDAHELTGRLVFGDEQYDSDVSKFRFFAKACVAEGELVLTDCGLVPIENVTRAMRVWDGQNFVLHSGIVYSGVKEVFTYDGLTATPDHIVFAEGPSTGVLEVSFRDAAKARLDLITTAVGGEPIRFRDHSQRPSALHTRFGFCRDTLRGMWSLGLDQLPQPQERTNSGVSFLRAGRTASVPPMAVGSDVCDPAEVRESQQSLVPPLWRAWSWLRLRVTTGSLRVCLAGVRPRGAVHDVGQDQYQRELRAGQPTLRHPEATAVQQEDHDSDRVPSGTLALWSGSGDSETQVRDDERADHSGGKGTGTDEGVTLQPRSRKTRVYDIRDAGPHHRFTVSGKLVHNCGHGSNYRIGAAKFAKMTKIALAEATKILSDYKAAYSAVTAWQERVFQEGNSGWVTNAWGRRMPVERGRSYTQSPGLLGQSTTREIMCDALLRIARHNIEWIRFIKVPVHDELILDIPDDQLDEVLPALPGLMQGTLNGIDFPVAVGAPAKNWRDATHA